MTGPLARICESMEQTQRRLEYLSGFDRCHTLGQGMAWTPELFAGWRNAKTAHEWALQSAQDVLAESWPAANDPQWRGVA